MGGFPRVLVAGIGNVFFGDDGFGVEVVRRLSRDPVAEEVEVMDAGIRGMHLAYHIADRCYDAVILIDAISRGEPPGTLYVIDPTDATAAVDIADAHTMTPDLVLGWLRAVGGRIDHITMVGCEPASLEPSMELSDTIADRIDAAIALVRDVIARAGERARSCA